MADEAPCGDQSDEVIFAKLKRFLVVALRKSVGSRKNVGSEGCCKGIFRKYVLSSCGRFSGGPGTVKLPRTLNDFLRGHQIREFLQNHITPLLCGASRHA